MRVAALYDIHGNVTALEAVLDEVASADVDHVLVGGDVFPGPHGIEVLERLDALPVPVDFISGNGDADVLSAREGRVPERVPEAVRPLLGWVAARIDDTTASRLDGWPASRTLDVAGMGPVLFCHATPGSDNAIFTVRTPEEDLIPAFMGVTARTVVCGHTHLPFERSVDGRRVVNPGSIGLPFDGPDAAWAVLGDGIEFRRTHYSFDEARRRASEIGYPGPFPIPPPGEETMLARYDAVRIGRTRSDGS